MPLSFHTRLTDAQVAAIDAAATFTDPRTGLRLSVSRQEVVSSVLDQWMALHATPAPGSADADAGVSVEGEGTVREETVHVIEDSAGVPALAAEELTPETPPLPAEEPGVVSTMPEEPEPSGGDAPPVVSPRRPPTKKKAKAKAKAKKRPTSSDLDAQVLAKVGELGPCSCAEVQKAVAMANSTVYGALQRLGAEGKVRKEGATYAVEMVMQAAP